MTTEALKTTAITNMDATPGVRLSAGSGAGDLTFTVMSSIVATTGMASGSTYRLARLPSNAMLQSLKLWLDASVTTFAGDITLYYSDLALDFPNGDTGLVTAHVFQTALDLHAVTTPTEYLLGGNIKGASLNLPLWSMAALTKDASGGMFDITMVLTSTTSGSPVLNCVAQYGQAAYQ